MNKNDLKIAYVSSYDYLFIVRNCILLFTYLLNSLFKLIQPCTLHISEN